MLDIANNHLDLGKKDEVDFTNIGASPSNRGMNCMGFGEIPTENPAPVAQDTVDVEPGAMPPLPECGKSLCFQRKRSRFWAEFARTDRGRTLEAARLSKTNLSPLSIVGPRFGSGTDGPS